ncbi:MULTISPECIES: OmpA family protein [unclassified Novosphingobium]|uniref:OmpA family protein n=1 Tax=unclassified Novosphingobium TaxID=2644732 RepID=UPI000869F703|nr:MULTISPECIES: OmpA family protein [unclassified Novosphingobium]MBN9144553.1 OmpA family protein [Novosphingobium sp.]MDR6707885.1 outer membrane protein OmpA-like peptidoglycan-associated protein [Novosphingobium sp. 1748]NKI98671.1 outer membrane protein OmpA-like peptidoglycan-associated protein [Novosphingobium sp. SG707]ODU84095.1 MAG: cell envelope biogenesis protein OmpA [Novosphingobium sp. SCN 63-17]OJX93649.1 MAG: cell envelope biogenesis protein OmpA [Novosphingobium sp. 63-713]
MRVMSKKSGILVLLATSAMTMAAAVSAQSPEAAKADITVNGTPIPDASQMTPGPEIKGFISARGGNRVQVTGPDGTKSVIAYNEATVIKASKGLFGSNKMDGGALLNGLPVTVRTMQFPGGLLASQITLRQGDLKMANMVRHGTDQRFASNEAATEALRGRMADIDNYNVKSTTNVHFDTGKATLSPQDKAELCNAASQAEGVSNALLLVVGYTDATGSDDFNQTLSEKRASSVINYLQQACHWKPYRMLTPTGMAKADPLASNDTPEGKAQNRRVSVNVLVSKAVDGV